MTTERENHPWLALQVKPVGEACNARCLYCYNPKKAGDSGRMSEAVLGSLLEKYAEYSPKRLTISWHGGEPLLAGLNYYKTAQTTLDSLLAKNQTVTHMLQTNAVLLNKDFADFFAKNKFSIGVSLDGPEDIHDTQRPLSNHTGSWKTVMQGIENLRTSGLEPAIICTVTKNSSKFPKEILDFFVKNKLFNISFSPVAFVAERNLANKDMVLNDSDWYHFMRGIFYEWCQYNDRRIQIRELNESIAWFVGKPFNLCSAGKGCPHWLSVTPNGNVFPCEYFGGNEPFGNIVEDNFQDVVKSEPFSKYRAEARSINPTCKDCQYFEVCGNGCRRMRLLDGTINPDGKYIYCHQRQKLFGEIKSCFGEILNNREEVEINEQK